MTREWMIKGYVKETDVKYNASGVPVYVDRLYSKGDKTSKARSMRWKGWDVKWEKVGVGVYAMWKKKRDAPEYDKFKDRFERATQYKHARSQGQVYIPVQDIKMTKTKPTKKHPYGKLVPEDTRIRTLMRKEGGYIDPTGKRVVLPMKRTETYGRKKRKAPVRRKPKYNTSKKWVWSFKLAKRKRRR